ncbi:hypothetical protein KSS87_011035 [Heliosperma pusillum]|nr:hypothetical protein KSS87_011035 [Heliosperma pusillum]
MFVHVEFGEGTEVNETLNQNDEDDVPSQKVFGKRRKSWVWNHFTVTKVKTSAGVIKFIGMYAYCNNASNNADSRVGTSNFKTNLLESCSEYKKINPTESSSWKEIDQKLYRELLAEAIMKHGYSFSWVERVRNRKIHKYLNDNVQHISRNTAKKLNVPVSFKLWVDVPTRWNSTYIMLDRVLKYKGALDNYFGSIDGTSMHVLDINDWEKVKKVLALRVIFDPRYKLEFVKYAFKKLHGQLEGLRKVDELKIHFEGLYEAYESQAHIFRPSDSRVTTRSINLADDFAEFAVYDQINAATTEIDVYLDEKKIAVETHLNVLVYWKENSDRFSILSSMTRDILPIPITTVASESLFSMGGGIISKWRSSLSSKSVEAIVTCKHWLTGYDDFNVDGNTVSVEVDSDDESD